MAVGALQVYVYQRGHILLAAKPYKAADLSEHSSHLTNASVSSKTLKEIGFEPEDLAMDTTEFQQRLDEEYGKGSKDVNKLVNDVSTSLP